jgi:hypothetical protein
MEGMKPQPGFLGNESGAKGTISGARGTTRQGLELVAIPSAQRELGSVVKHDHLIAVKERIERLDALYVDQGRAVDAEKPRWIEPRLQVGERLPQEMGLPERVHSDVVVGGFHPVDVVDLENL